ncbi:putative methyltransferase [Colletotrichum sp. SAR 10_75]|nr:putative methyltransferase [Colletotrichum sp. SAR 10_75]
MAETLITPAPTSVPRENTFRKYTAEQGKFYAKGRPVYDDCLYDIIIDHHKSTGGKLDTLLDIGTGPGTVARGLGPRFKEVIGLDPAAGMIAAARSFGGVSGNSEPIRFDVSTAEELGSNLSPAVADGSVDLVTAATAAHWFDMPGFWAAAARVLKPGGTVAIWSGSSMYIHPSVPNHEHIQGVLNEFRNQHLVPYMVQGNHIGETLYEDLPLPWTVENPIREFDQSTFYRKEWNKDGIVDEDGEFFHQLTWNMDDVENMMITVSPVTRWREAHPDLVGTDRDVVKMLRKQIETLLHEAGVEKGKETITTGWSGALLMVKKAT